MRILCLVITFILLQQSALAEELKIFTSGGFQGVSDENDQVVIPAVYEKLGWSDGSDQIVNQSIGFFEHGSWGIINISSKKLSSAQYAVLKPFNESLYEAGIIGKFSNRIFKGLIDNRGRIALDVKYYTLEKIGLHSVVVSEYVDGGLRYGLYSDENLELLPVTFRSIEVLGDILLAKNDASKIHVFDASANLLLHPWVDEVYLSSKGYIVKNDGYYGLLNHDGIKVLDLSYKFIDDHSLKSFPTWRVKKIDSDENQEILCDSLVYDLESDLLIAHVNNAHHILSGTQLFQDQQHSLKHIGNGFLVTKDNVTSKWGIYKTDGRMVAQGFDSVGVDQNYFYTLSGKKWDVYNFFGRKLNEAPFQELGWSQNKNIPARKNEYWGWLDFQTKQLVDYQLEEIRTTNHPSQFIGRRFGLWGVQDFHGNWVIMPNFHQIDRFGTFYLCRKGGATHIYHESGKLLYEISYQVSTDQFIRLADEGLIGAVTSEGYLFDPVYDEISIVDSMYVLKRNGLASVYFPNGRLIFGTEVGVQSVLSYSENFLHIIKDGKHGFVDMNGKLRIANRYDSAQYFHEELAPVKLRGKWGFIGPYENLIIQPFYQNSSTFLNGLAIVKYNNQFGLINKKGEEVVQIQWKKIERLKTGNYKVTDWDGKVGLVNTVGRFVIRPNFNQIEDTDKQLIIVTNGSKKGVLDYAGLTKVPFEYSTIQVQGDYLLMRK